MLLTSKNTLHRLHLKQPMRLFMAACFALFGQLLLTTSSAHSQTTNNSPIVTFTQLVQSLESKAPEVALIERIEESPTLFTLSKEQEDILRKAGASESLMKRLKHRIAILERMHSDIQSYVIILDCSGSMMDKGADGNVKFPAAQQAVGNLLKAIPNGRQVAFIVYGTEPAKRCEDVRVVMPLRAIDQATKDGLMELVGSLKAQGHTPIALALKKAGTELANIKGKGARSDGMSKILLITDGVETCHGDPEAEAAKLAQITNFQGVDVIGLNLTSQESAAVKGIANRGRGKFYDAQSTAELERAIAKVEKETIASKKTTAEEITIAGHTSDVHQVTYSEDGKLIATASADKTARIWDAGTGDRLLRINHEKEAYCAAFSPDGAKLAVAGEAGKITIYDTKSGDALVNMTSDETVALLAYSPNGNGKFLATVGKELAFGGKEQAIATIWDVSSGKVVQSLTGHNGIIQDLAFSPDGKLLATVGTDSTIRLWDYEKGMEKDSLKHHEGPVQAVRFNTDGTQLLTGGADAKLARWTVKSGKLIKPVFECPAEEHGGIISVGYLKNGAVIGFRYNGGAVVFDSTTGKVVSQQPGEKLLVVNGFWSYPVKRKSVAPLGDSVATTIADHVVKIYRSEQKELQPK